MGTWTCEIHMSLHRKRNGQGYRFFTPEGREVRPEEMRWWSLTCTTAREWTPMMAEERERVRHPRPAEVIYLRDVIRRRREIPLILNSPHACML
ncbi:hypothetical protein VDS41_05480 [Xanthomonas campestris pv. campestris]|nr:hypothetical protein [Xanthomonas campestris pv. campestris]